MIVTHHYQPSKYTRRCNDIHTGKVGGVKVRLLSQIEATDDDINHISIDDTIKTLPLLGEEVQLTSIAGKRYYTRLQHHNL